MSDENKVKDLLYAAGQVVDRLPAITGSEGYQYQHGRPHVLIGVPETDLYLLHATVERLTQQGGKDE